MTNIQCPKCSEDQQITVYYTAPLKCVCRSCNHEWRHDPVTCPKCHSDELTEIETYPVRYVCERCDINFSSDNGLRVLSGLDAIRVRPKMYLGFTAQHCREVLAGRYVPDPIPPDAVVDVDIDEEAIWRWTNADGIVITTPIRNAVGQSTITPVDGPTVLRMRFHMYAGISVTTMRNKYVGWGKFFKVPEDIPEEATLQKREDGVVVWKWATGEVVV